MGRRWGIAGTGGIAAAFATALVAEGEQVVAVSSGSAERAAAFAAAHGVPAAYGRHEQLVTDPAVEVVYVATTNDRHPADIRAAIGAGLPVLAEKPLALTAAEARELFAAAEQAGVLLAEAMWMRVQPGFERLHELLADGAIGTVHSVQASFGVPLPTDPSRRWFSAELGGGSLLDVGIYPVTLALSVLGAPTALSAQGHLAASGVDSHVAVAMRHGPGRVSSLVSSFVADQGVEAVVGGSDGSLRLTHPFHHTPALELRRRGGLVERIEVEGHELGLRHEVREVLRCLDAGATTSARLTPADTVAALEVLDQLRAQLGAT